MNYIGLLLWWILTQVFLNVVIERQKNIKQCSLSHSSFTFWLSLNVFISNDLTCCCHVISSVLLFFVVFCVHSLSAFTHFTLLRVASSFHGVERYQAFVLLTFCLSSSHIICLIVHSSLPLILFLSLHYIYWKMVKLWLIHASL